MILSVPVLQDLRFSQWWCWKFKSSGMWHCFVRCTVHIISKDHNAFIFTFKQNSSWKIWPWQWR